MALHRRLFFLLLVFLPAQLGFHFWPQWSYVLGRRVDYLSPTIYLTDILIFLLIGSWMILEKPACRQAGWGSLGRLGKLEFSVVLFALANIYFAASPWVAAYKWLKVFEFVGLGWYIVQTKPRRSAVSRQLSVGVLYSSLIAIGQFALQQSIGGPLWLLGERTFDIETPGIARWEGFGKLLLRPYATFPHPNALGGYLAVVLPMFANPVAFVFGLPALALTFSRSAWVAFLIGVGLINRKLILPVLLIVVFILLRVNAHEESVMVRNDLNAAAISMWKQSPLVGVGLGNFVVELPRQSLNRYGNFLQPVHNIYLLVLSETGILGTLLFLWVLNKGIRGAWGATGKLPLITFLLLGLVDHYPLTLQQGQLLFTLTLALSMIK